MIDKLNGLGLALLCGAYSLFYTFCLYKNYSGVTFPFFAAGTLFVFVYYMKKQGLTMKTFSVFPVAGILIFSTHVCLTGSAILADFDRAFIFVLFFTLFLHNLYDDSDWDVSRYLGAIAAMAASSVRFLPRPVKDLIGFIKDHKKKDEGEAGKGHGAGLYIFIGLAISVPILLVVLPLLASSDAVFKELLDNIMYFEFDFNEDIIGVAWMILVIFFVAYALITRLNVRMQKLDSPSEDKRRANPIVAITVSTVMLIVYGLYCIIQIVYLFMGYGTLPDGYTYAKYVHEGFYQLVFVCIINLILVLLCRKYSKDNTVLKVMLSLISMCTFIMIFSSAYRMALYVDAYGLTFLRLYVLWALAVIGLAMIGTLIFIFVPGMPFCKYCMVVLTCMWAAFICIRPDYSIAAYNLQTQDDCDYHYIFHSLSTDAAPAVDKYLDDEELKINYLKEVMDYGDLAPTPIRKFNYSRWVVLKLRDKYGI